MKWLGELQQKDCKDKDQGSIKVSVRDGIIADETYSIPISIWGKLIDQVEEDQTITITKVKLRFYYGSTLTTTNESVITTAQESIQVDWNK